MANTPSRKPTGSRHRWQECFIVGGGALRAFDLLRVLDDDRRREVERRLANSHLLVSPPGPDERQQGATGTSAAIAIARRLLQRGTVPPLHPLVEARLLTGAGFGDLVTDDRRGDLTPRLGPESEPPAAEDLQTALAWSQQSPRARDPRLPVAARRLLPLLFGPAAATRLGLALLEAVERGWLEANGVWTVEVDETVAVTPIVLPPVLELFSAAEVLGGERLSPRKCRLIAGEKSFFYRRRGVASFERTRAGVGGSRPQVKLVQEVDREGASDLPDPGKVPTVVIRSCAPSQSAGTLLPASSPAAATERSDATDRALTWLLQAIFARKGFRPAQLDAVYRLLGGADCVVNLPPGVGKSLVYQLTGLLSGHATLVVTPDEPTASAGIAALGGHGIDRAGTLTGESVATDIFVFTTSDGLRSVDGRSRLQALDGERAVGTVVVDEAQETSEWCADFRLASTGLRRTLCDTGILTRQPQILALAATPSRELLRDLLVQLTRNEPDTLVEIPDSQRSMTVDVVRSNPRQAHRALTDLLAKLPKRFSLPAVRFFATDNAHRPQGLVVCSRLDGPYGIVAVRESIREADLCSRIGLFAADTPAELEPADFERARARDLSDFTLGTLPLMVATVDLARTLDVTRLRYVVLFGMPPSLDLLQQSTRRLHPSEEPAVRLLIHMPQAETRLQALLSSETTAEEVHADLLAADAVLPEPADTLRALRRHSEWFAGADAELRGVGGLLEDSEFRPDASVLTVPLGADPTARRRAACRLVSVGVLRDWDEDPATATLRIFPQPVSGAQAETDFWRLALRTRPASVGSQELSFIDVHDAGSAASILDRTRRYLDLLYESIEPRRRQSIAALETVAGRAGKRTLPPATVCLGGKLAADLESVAVGRPRRIETWLPCLGDVIPEQAPELERAARASSSHSRNDPGLHLARAVATLLRARDRESFAAEMTAAFLGTHVEYGEEWSSLRALFSWMLPRVKALSPSWTVDLWTAWERAEAALERRRKPSVWPFHLLRDAEILSLSEPSQPADEAVVVLERRLREACSILDSLKEHFSMEESEL